MDQIQQQLKELERIKTFLTEEKSKIDQANAKMDFIIEELQKNFDINNIEEAEELKQQLEQEKLEIEKTIEEKLDKLITGMKKDGFIT